MTDLFPSRNWLALTCAAGLLLPLHAAQDAPPLTAAELLDEAIWWPGDFGQVCSSDGLYGKFHNAPIPGYGTSSGMEEYYLSQATIDRLRARREDLIPEICERLKAFNWRKFPKKPEPSPRVKALAQGSLSKLKSDGPGPGAWSVENSRALGYRMLRVIEEVEAVEALPLLLSLEADLNALNDTAVEAAWKAQGEARKKGPVPPKNVYVPPIEAGAFGSYEEWNQEWRQLGRPDKSAWMEWKGQVFGNLVFQRQILGVGLAMLEKRKYQPLRDSIIGRLRALELRQRGLETMAETGVRRARDITAQNREDGLWWDEDLSVPRWTAERTRIPWSNEIREEARRLMEDFIAGGSAKQTVNGESLLAKLLAQPGDFNQMCTLGPPLDASVPLPSGSRLLSRHFNFNQASRERMQAYRKELMPALVSRMGTIQLASANTSVPAALTPDNSGQSPSELGPLMLRMADTLQAVECLPHLLRLEEELHTVLAKAATDPAVSLPKLNLDTLVMLQPSAGNKAVPVEDTDVEREMAMVSCRVLQRELLGLIRTLLVREDCPGLKESQTEKAIAAAMKERLATALRTIKSEDQIPADLQKVVTWSDYDKSAEAKEDAKFDVTIPYTEATREEIVKLAKSYLKKVPAAKRKGSDAMVLEWLEDPVL